VINLTDIAYVRSGVADLSEAVRFATEIVGLEAVASDESGVVHLRADQRHHCLTFVEGHSGVISSGFTVADYDALDDAETQLEHRGIRVSRGDAVGARSRAVGDYIAFDDPFGNRVELVVAQRLSAEPVRLTRPSGITEFGHLCLDAPNAREAHRFWSTVFNARASDWVGEAVCLMRIDALHHKLAIFHGDEPALCHIDFQVSALDDVFRNWHFLEERGVEILMGPGRHPTSGSVFVYFRGPEGLTYEYATGTRLIEDESTWRPRVFDPGQPSSIDMWRGPIQPLTRQKQIPVAEPAADAPRKREEMGTPQVHVVPAL
ncbi:MAG: 2,3-dihydroxy-p-cumate/2,3-dihydroxybenzoate 3,4-dioxygenase, partial [Mycobacterium sp.]|nr:2,3-dihydroxy-p-cumate/2,3-dihydroxybenzoate 3,4-dioxygenase [Mycobacterium sp.]